MLQFFEMRTSSQTNDGHEGHEQTQVQQDTEALSPSLVRQLLSL